MRIGGAGLGIGVDAFAKVGCRPPAEMAPVGRHTALRAAPLRCCCCVGRSRCGAQQRSLATGTYARSLTAAIASSRCIGPSSRKTLLRMTSAGDEKPETKTGKPGTKNWSAPVFSSRDNRQQKRVHRICPHISDRVHSQEFSNTVKQHITKKLDTLAREDVLKFATCMRTGLQHVDECTFEIWFEWVSAFTLL